MTVVALGSIKGAPGVTTTALALASVWPASRAVVVAEVDPDGGVLAARRDLGLEPGLATLAAALRRGGADVSPHTQSVGDRVRAIVTPPSGEQTRAALAVAGERLWQALEALTDDVLADCGRLTAGSPVTGVARHADVTVLLARPRLDDVALLRERVPALRREGVEPQVLLTGGGPYRREEVADAIEAPVLAVLPIDGRTAAALDQPSGRRVSSRSPLVRSTRQLAGTLLSHAGATTRLRS
jgi:MinD-like ATPase involved in chromosome partitioning or flagellar assembly